MLRVQDPGTFLLLNALNGLGAGCIWPAVYAGVADTYRRSERGLIMGILSTVMLGGLAAGPITGNILLGLTSYRAAFLTCIALVGVVLVVVVSLARETRQTAQHSNVLPVGDHLRSLTRELL